MKEETMLVTNRIMPDPLANSIIPPLYQTATYVLDNVGEGKGYDYTRSSNPTRELLEKKITLMEKGVATSCFSSGMAAVDAVLKFLSTGDHLVCSEDVYGGVTRLINEIISRCGINIDYVDTTDIMQIENVLNENTKMIFVETPSNPGLRISNIKEVADIAMLNGLLFAVDSTFATPLGINPLLLGADFVIHSTTKYISGHNLIIGGSVTVKDLNHGEKLKRIQKTIGAVPSPFDCWLTLTGLKTLALRMEKHDKNAIELARFLQNHKAVKTVKYPGLESHPQHSLALNQYNYFGGMLTFELNGDLNDAVNFINKLDIASLAESLGSVETMVTHPATMTHADVPQEERLYRGISNTFIRVSVGIENIQDIINDFAFALDYVLESQDKMHISDKK